MDFQFIKFALLLVYDMMIKNEIVNLIFSIRFYLLSYWDRAILIYKIHLIIEHNTSKIKVMTNENESITNRYFK